MSQKVYICSIPNLHVGKWIEKGFILDWRRIVTMGKALLIKGTGF